MPFISDRDFESWRASDERVQALANERDDLRTKVESACLLVAGACRQGFVNPTQELALLYAFMRLTGEQSEQLAKLMVHITPKVFRGNVTARKPQDFREPWHVSATELVDKHSAT